MNGSNGEVRPENGTDSGNGDIVGDNGNGNETVVQSNETQFFDPSPACPCINPWSSFAVSPYQGNCTNDSYISILNNINQQECIPANYGIDMCRPWNSYNGYSSSQCSGENEGDDDCRYSFCFVNASNCERPNIPW